MTERQDNALLIASVAILILFGGISLLYWGMTPLTGMAVLQTTTTFARPTPTTTPMWTNQPEAPTTTTLAAEITAENTVQETTTTMQTAPYVEYPLPATPPGTNQVDGNAIQQTTTTMETASTSRDLMVRIRDDPKLGKILVDNLGMTLYMRRTDPPKDSECSGTCAVTWPPLRLEGVLLANPEIPGRLSVIQRGYGGGPQVTYNDKPLYYFEGDTLPGETNGHGAAGNWYVVRIKEPEAIPSAS